MTLPNSFTQAGFKSVDTIKPKRRRVMIGTEGESESGKSEFILSAPGPGIVISIDRGHEAMLDNPNPPPTRRNDYAFEIINIPLVSQTTQSDYLTAWKNFKERTYKAIAIPEAFTVAIDTDNASWELQQLAEFGKITQIPPIMRTSVNAARRAFISRLYDSGKNIIATNMLKDEYATLRDEEGNIVLKDGKETMEKTGKRKRQGFSDQNYLWQIQLRHLVRPAGVNPVTKKHSPRKYGIRILKCKANSEYEGSELWGEDCNFLSLVQLVYPNTTPQEWGYK